VGVLDLDICGPSIPSLLGVVNGQIRAEDREGAGKGNWEPIWVSENLCCMSIGFMLPGRDSAVVWRGPRKNGLIKQFLSSVNWGPLDYLIVDTPPGTSDEHISIVQYFSEFDLSAASTASGAAADETGITAAVLVTTPEEVAVNDVRRQVTFCKKVKLPILGVVENMSGLRLNASDCAFVDQNGVDKTEEILKLLGSGGGTVLSECFGKSSEKNTICDEYGINFLGKVPLDPTVGKSGDLGISLVEASGENGGGDTMAAIAEVVEGILEKTGEKE